MYTYVYKCLACQPGQPGPAGGSIGGGGRRVGGGGSTVAPKVYHEV